MAPKLAGDSSEHALTRERRAPVAIFLFLLSGCLGFPYMPEYVVESEKCTERTERIPQVINLPRREPVQVARTESPEDTCLPPIEDPTHDTWSEIRKLPYPCAKAPDPYPAVAASPDSDCGGLIDIPLPVRLGTWAIGEVRSGKFEPDLFFNTREDALDCVGSQPAEVGIFTEHGWTASVAMRRM